MCIVENCNNQSNPDTLTCNDCNSEMVSIKKHESDIINLDYALHFASTRHGEQLYNRNPYYVHLLAVDSVACRFGFFDNKIVRAGCILHDVVEDKKASLEEIKNEFGLAVANIVKCVSDVEGHDKKMAFREPNQTQP